MDRKVDPRGRDRTTMRTRKEWRTDVDPEVCGPDSPWIPHASEISNNFNISPDFDLFVLFHKSVFHICHFEKPNAQNTNPVSNPNRMYFHRSHAPVWKSCHKCTNRQLGHMSRWYPQIFYPKKLEKLEHSSLKNINVFCDFYGKSESEVGIYWDGPGSVIGIFFQIFKNPRLLRFLQMQACNLTNFNPSDIQELLYYN